jgi:hypothetical protein
VAELFERRAPKDAGTLAEVTGEAFRRLFFRGSPPIIRHIYNT